MKQVVDLKQLQQSIYAKIEKMVFSRKKRANGVFMFLHGTRKC